MPPRVVVGPQLTSDDMHVMLETVLSSPRDARRPVLVVDLSEVEEIDARGVVMLIAWRRLATSRGVQLVVEAPARVAAQLAQLRLDHVFRIRETADALAG